MVQEGAGPANPVKGETHNWQNTNSNVLYQLKQSQAQPKFKHIEKYTSTPAGKSGHDSYIMAIRLARFQSRLHFNLGIYSREPVS